MSAGPQSANLSGAEGGRARCGSPQGTRNLYEINTKAIRALRTSLDGFWNDTLSAFKQAAEREAGKKSKLQ